LCRKNSCALPSPNSIQAILSTLRCKTLFLFSFINQMQQFTSLFFLDFFMFLLFILVVFFVILIISKTVFVVFL
jgi:hypothetical protein